MLRSPRLFPNVNFATYKIQHEFVPLYSLAVLYDLTFICEGFFQHTFLPQKTAKTTDNLMKEKGEDTEEDLTNSRSFVLEDYSLTGTRGPDDDDEIHSSRRAKVLGPCNAWLWQ